MRQRTVTKENKLSSLENDVENHKKEPNESGRKCIISPDCNQSQFDEEVVPCPSSVSSSLGNDDDISLVRKKTKKKKRRAPPPPLSITDCNEYLNNTATVAQETHFECSSISQSISPSLLRLASNLQEASNRTLSNLELHSCQLLPIPNPIAETPLNTLHEDTNQLQCISPSLLHLASNLQEASNRTLSNLRLHSCHSPPMPNQIVETPENTLHEDRDKFQCISPSLLHLASNLHEASNRTLSNLMLYSCQSPPITDPIVEKTFYELQEDVNNETFDLMPQYLEAIDKTDTESSTEINYLDALSRKLDCAIGDSTGITNNIQNSSNCSIHPSNR